MSYTRYWLVFLVVIWAMAFFDKVDALSPWSGWLFGLTVGGLLAWIMNKPLKDGRKLAKLDSARLQVIGLWRRSKRANFDTDSDYYAMGYHEALDQATRLMARELGRR